MTAAVILCRILSFFGRLIGRGSSMPGAIVLKIFPDILGKIKFDGKVIAVSGSNGKTSTTELIANILSGEGKTVLWNKEGSNQTEGVATLLLNGCTLRGRVRADFVVIESDERYARLTFSHFTPDYFVITNLFRDQMTRNGHSEWVRGLLGKAISEKTVLILNADEPLSASYGNADTVYYSIDENRYSAKEHAGVYNDGAVCPLCKGKMEYGYFNVGHLGAYRCNDCGFGGLGERAKYRITDIDLEKGRALFDGKYDVSLAFGGLYNTYNLLAAYSVCAECGILPEKAASHISDYVLSGGRIKSFVYGGSEAMLLISKHENSVSYNSTIDYIVRSGGDCDVLIMVNSISRKYYTCDTSWLWDIDFGRLRSGNIGKIVLCGRYCYDLQMRFLLIGFDNLEIVENPDEAVRRVPSNGRKTFFVTCFADRARLAAALEKSEGRKVL